MTFPLKFYWSPYERVLHYPKREKVRSIKSVSNLSTIVKSFKYIFTYKTPKCTVSSSRLHLSPSVLVTKFAFAGRDIRVWSTPLRMCMFG